MTTFVSDLQLAARYSISRATVWRWVVAGHLPKPVRLSPGCTRWKLSDIESRDAALELVGIAGGADRKNI